MDNAIPPNVLAEIERIACEDWPNDAEMQKYAISAETQAYCTLMNVDYGKAIAHQSTILNNADGIFPESWEEKLNFVVEEIAAFATLADLAPTDVPADFLADEKRKAAAEQDGYFWAQLEDVEKAINGYRYIQRTRAEVAPIRDLLTRMEAIIGSECYNSNIQNYGAWGVWEGEGRSFRYPVTYTKSH